MTNIPPAPVHGGRAWRAAALFGLASSAAWFGLRLHPAVPSSTLTPEAAVVSGCAWVAWFALLYLAAAVGLSAASQLLAPRGAAAGRIARRAGAAVPAPLHRWVGAVLSAGVLAGVAGAPSPATALPSGTAGGPAAHAVPDPLDWPGLAPPPAHRPGHPRPAPRRAGASPAAQHRHEASHLGGTRQGATVVVQPGDTLWSIAARRLGAAATPTRVAAAWPAWFAANRAAIGPDPDLILPGERLVPPATPGARR